MEPLSEDPYASHLPRGQEGLHPDLEAVVRRHLSAPDRAPVPEHTRAAYVKIRPVLSEVERPVILDSGCGTGSGAAALAAARPDAWVIGVDQSLARLRKGPGRPGMRAGFHRQDNLLLARADVPGLWRLLAKDGLHLAEHRLFYPNPWPKKRHLMRRWHGHPAFSALLELGGRLELRTNWPVYAEELAAALRVAADVRDLRLELLVEPWSPEAPETRFEAKYAASGHDLLRVVARWGP